MSRIGILVLMLLAAAIVLICALAVLAHPGRVDKHGCHTVGPEGYSYKDGTYLKPGSRHAHGTGGTAALGGMGWKCETMPEKEDKPAWEKPKKEKTK